MIKKFSMLFLALLIAVSTLSSCYEDRPESTRVSEDLSAAESTTQIPTEEPTEASMTISAEKVVFDEYEPYMDIWRCSYLINPEKARVFDDDIRDGLLAHDKFDEVELPAGTILSDLDEFRPDLVLYPGKTLFILADDRCVFFEQSASDIGELRYNGKPVPEFLGTVKSDYEYFEGETTVVENYELLPNTSLDSSIAPQNIIVNVDWNGDGKTDIITRECADAKRTWEQKVWFTDGATGKKTDITDRFARDESEEYGGITDYVMLFQDEKTGRYALIDCFDTCSCDYSIFVYSYDPGTIIKYDETGGVFVYEDDKMYVDDGSYIFGNLTSMRTPLVFDGKRVFRDPNVQEYWWLAALKAEETGDALPDYFSYTLKDVSVEKKTGSGYEEHVIPAGIAVFPRYFRWDEGKGNESGYLYFVLADGSDCRIGFETESEWWACTFDGVPQNELFFCSWGG